VTVLITGFPAGAFAANCYLAAPGPGEECVIIDPGQDAEPGIEELIARYRLRPIAVLLTHGHVDHMFSVAPVCGAKGIPAYIHPGDRARLGDPVGPWANTALRGLFTGVTFTEPDDVRELADGETITLGGLDITIAHVPGHTEGSVTFQTPLPDERGVTPPLGGNGGTGSPPTRRGGLGGIAPPEAAGSGGDRSPRGNMVLFTGDLLFAGSIGRTDLPGGDHGKMLKSLARTLAQQSDETVVLPGHGSQTTIGAERRGNPFLTGLKPAQKGM
jgi:hydroxyacylglutathione hydrolase